jgi:hypothetical protein
MSNEKNLAAYNANRREVQAILARLAEAIGGPNYDPDPEALNWGQVGDLHTLAILLREISERVFGEEDGD